jgi:Amt family ammonium transporter
MALDLASTGLILVCMALVQLMTPGLALFYGGLVRETSVITMMMQNFVAMGLVTILWYVFIYSLCFGEHVPKCSTPPCDSFFGNPGTYFGFKDVKIHEEGPAAGIPHLLFAGYQGMFAVITPALMTGCFADRFKFGPYMVFVCIWMILVYAPFCHAVWGGGWMAKWGVWDFAGGIVVHITAGFSALATLLVVGKRYVPDGLPKEELDVPHDIPMVALGTALLWFGWFGFNGGSALGSGGLAVVAAVNSEIAGSTACFVWMFIDWVRNKKPSLVGLCVGAIAGLATVTPAAGFIQPWGAFIIGLIAAPVCYVCCVLKNKIGLDDALDVWGVHGMGGFIGTLLVGVLSDPPECASKDPLQPPPTWCANPKTVSRSGEQFAKQLAAACITATYSFVVTVVVLKIMGLFCDIVPAPEDQVELDAKLHGENAHTPPKAYAPDTAAKTDLVGKGAPPQGEI